ncbi:putative membrane protein [Natranaeroarchaeum sulfidigenes]|uniref:Putative membrane protein n=2 Tax=Natranaeroarchaeum sulfidigenes TaxID=2784880 RepID=A0A897MUC9_9EURY|nr:putative membrane protein [Natranaeroarchaeum sulfidigenes]
MGKWTPNTTGGWIAYRLWAAVGVPVVAVLYPLALSGLMFRFYASRIDRVAAGLGVAGVVVLAALVWGVLTVAAHQVFSFDGFLAVLAAAVVATIAAGLAVAFSQVGGRLVSVVFAYPSAMTALFLPPVVAALVSPTLGEVVLSGSDSLAIWLLDTVLVVGGLSEWLSDQYTLAGAAYLGMWFGIAVPLGWLIGSLVTLAGLVRPT